METLIALIVIMWLLGMATSYTLNGFIHLLLVLAIVMVIVRALKGRRV